MRPRWWLVVLALAIGAVFLGAYWQWVIIHLSQETGTSNSASRAYDYWSGFGSIFPWSFGIFIGIWGGIIGTVRHHNCHVKRCWSWKTRPVDGTPYVMCHVHHPDHKGEERNLPHEELLAHIRELRA